MLVRTHAEVLDGLAAVPLPPQQDGVRTSRRTESELIESQNFTTSLEDSLFGRGGETEGGNGEFGHLQETNIIGDGSNNNNDLGVTLNRV